MREIRRFLHFGADAAVVSGDSGNVGAADGDGDFGFRVVGATPESANALAFGRRKVGVVKRPSAVEGAGGVSGAGAFGALAAREEEVDITFSLPKPRRKEKKEKRKEKAAVEAAVDAAEKEAEGDSGAAEATAVAAVAADGELRDLETCFDDRV